ncbi:MAG: aldo/keto reductase, partial [Deltaproteobacteria bacterium]|nr:aldo/keto reductase [Deltaproteobacteria bacterium]
FEPAYLRRCIEGSLRRLRREALDVFLLHNPLPGRIDAGGVFGLLAGLREKGLIRHYGVSCGRAEHAAWALDGRAEHTAWALDQPGVEVVELPVSVVDSVRARHRPHPSGRGAAIRRPRGPRGRRARAHGQPPPRGREPARVG